MEHAYVTVDVGQLERARGEIATFHRTTGVLDHRPSTRVDRAAALCHRHHFGDRVMLPQTSAGSAPTGHPALTPPGRGVPEQASWEHEPDTPATGDGDWPKAA